MNTHVLSTFFSDHFLSARVPSVEAATYCRVRFISFHRLLVNSVHSGEEVVVASTLVHRAAQHLLVNARRMFQKFWLQKKGKSIRHPLCAAQVVLAVCLPFRLGFFSSQNLATELVTWSTIRSATSR